MVKKKKKRSLRDRLKEKQARIRSQKGGRVRTIKEGTLRVRPLKVGEEKDWAIEVLWCFPNKDIGGFVSPRSFGERCAWMDFYDKMMASKKESDRKFAKEKLGGRRKSLMGVGFYKDTKGHETDGKGLLLITPTQNDELIDLWMDDDDGGDFTDPVNGYDIKFKRVGSGLNTRYTQMKCDKSKCPKEWREGLDLEEEVRKLVPSYEQTKEYVKTFMNSATDEDEGDDDEAPIKKKKKKKKSRDL